MTPKLISRPVDVDAGWLTEVLHYSGALPPTATVTSFRSEPVGTGQIGCNLRYRLRYDPESAGPGSIVIKFASDDETSRAAGIQTGTYATEVAFHRDLAETVDICRPRCHFCDISPGSAEVVLVFDDLAPAVQGDQTAGCTVQMAELAMREAAKLHGPRWNDPSCSTSHGWLGRPEAAGAPPAATC